MELKLFSVFTKFHFINPRWWVFSRIIAAMFGGYVFTTSSSLLISQLLSELIGKYQAVHISLMLSFLVYACVVMWVFSVASAKQAWIGLIKANVFCLTFTWLLLQFINMSS
jgi:hypothetical protein